MIYARPSKATARTAPLLALFLLASCLGLSCSTHKTVGVPKLLTPVVETDTAKLIGEVNRLAAVKGVHGKLDIQFQDTSFASEGIAEKYSSADASVTLQRPRKVYLIIQVPVIAADVAQMTSDGEHFRVAVLKGEEKYRRFVKGTNDAHYEQLTTTRESDSKNKGDKKKGAERATVSALSNLRPQHLTDALLIQPISPPAETGLTYSRSEFYQEEPDTRPAARRNTPIVRSYYLLEEFGATAGGEVKLKRRFWFDRVESIKLSRLQTFDDQGRLDTDISYGDYKVLGDNPSALMASHIELTRPRDQYKLSLTYQDPLSVTINKEYPDTVFVLENRWGLPEVDLDARKEPRATTTP